jgi:D-alanyl-D-alanine carboxypeptidase
MKSQIISILAVVAFSIFSSCEKQIDMPVTDIIFPIPDNTHTKGQQFQNKLNEYTAKGLVGVSLSVDDPVNGFWAGASGKACLETGEDMTKYNLQYSGSIPKMYIGTLIMLLNEASLIDLNAKINQYLPKDMCDQLTNGNEITIYQLMTHSSGLYDYAEDPQAYFDFMNDPNSIHWTPEQMLEIMYGKKAVFAPGAKHEYCNSNFLLLAVIIDQIKGNHAQYLKDAVLDPQGLTQTYYKIQAGYPYPDGTVNAYADYYATGMVINITDIYDNKWNLMVGDDGMIAAPYDYLRFTKSLFEGNIVSLESLAKMQEWFYWNDSDENSWRSGLAIHCWRNDAKDIWGMGHSGSTDGMGGFAFYFPEKAVTIALFTNEGVERGEAGPLFYSLWEDIVEIANR